MVWWWFKNAEPEMLGRVPAYVAVPDTGYVAHFLPDDLDAVWLRLRTDRDCIATAFLHQTTSQFIDRTTPEHQALFAGLADVTADDALGALIYAAKRNRNLRAITGHDRYFEFTKASFEFRQDEPDPQLRELLHVDPEFTVDDASAIVKYQSVLAARIPQKR